MRVTLAKAFISESLVAISKRKVSEQPWPSTDGPASMSYNVRDIGFSGDLIPSLPIVFRAFFTAMPIFSIV